VLESGLAKSNGAETGPGSFRSTAYIDRQIAPGELSARADFDRSPDSSTPLRYQATSATALFLLNGPFVHAQAAR